MNAYLLIANDCRDDNDEKISAKNVALHRLERGFWNIYPNTSAENLFYDSVIIYLAGHS